jgi:hypothetical protein
MMSDRDEMARDLFGSGWWDLPDAARVAAVDFADEMLGLTVSEFVYDAAGAAFEAADRMVPIWDHERLALLTDVRACRAIEDALHEFGSLDGMTGSEFSFATLAGSGWCLVLVDVFARMLDTLTAGPDGFAVFGLDDDAAEVAAALLSDWSGTLGELVEAAPRLAVDGVEVGR